MAKRRNAERRHSRCCVVGTGTASPTRGPHSDECVRTIKILQRSRPGGCVCPGGGRGLGHADPAVRGGGKCGHRAQGEPRYSGCEGRGGCGSCWDGGGLCWRREPTADRKQRCTPGLRLKVFNHFSRIQIRFQQKLFWGSQEFTY